MIEKTGSAESYTQVLDEATFLGPAEMVGRRGKGIEASLPDGRVVQAAIALAWPVPLEAGDSLLLVGRDNQFFVIGVLTAQKANKLRFFGDVLLHAVGGRIDLESDDEVALHAPNVAIRTGKLTTVAKAVVERASTLYQNVREVLSIHAGEKREIVRGEWMARAERANITTSGTVSVNGKEVHLG